MARFLASLFEDTLGIVFEEFSKEQVSSSLFRGKFSASNLRIRREFLDEILFPLKCESASCKSVEIDLPVGSLESMPLRITIGRVFINLSCSSQIAPPASNFLKRLKLGGADPKSDKKDKDRGSWSKAARILCGILLEVDLVEVRADIGAFSLRACLRDLVLQSTSADWAPVARSGLLEQCFDDSAVPGQVTLFKVLQIAGLQLQIISLEAAQCSTIVDIAFKANIALSLLKENLTPTELFFDASLSRFTVSLNNEQVERLYKAGFDIARLFRSVSVKNPSISSELAPIEAQPELNICQWELPTEVAMKSYEAFFREEGGVKNLTHNFRKFPQSFTGNSFVTWLVTPNPKASLVARMQATVPDKAVTAKSDCHSWSHEDLSRIEQEFRSHCHALIKDHRHRLKSYPNTFLGSDLCSWLVNDEHARVFKITTREDAVSCGRAMLYYKIAHPVLDEHGFDDSDKCYIRFSSDDTDHAHSAVGTSSSIAPRISPFALSRQHATFIGQCLLKSQHIKQVDNLQNFLDESVLYQFSSDISIEKSQIANSLPNDAHTNETIVFPHIKANFSLCKTEVIIGSSTPAAAPKKVQTAEVLSLNQKLADGSAFKCNAAGHLDRRSDIIKSWERRFVVVRDGDVAIFDKEEDAVSGKQPRKFYLLRDCEVRPTPLPGHPLAFEVILTAPVKKILIFSTVVASSGDSNVEARDNWIQVFRHSGSQLSSGTRVVAVEESFVEVSSIHPEAWQVSLVVDPVMIPFELKNDQNWNIDCKPLSISLQSLDTYGSKRSLLSIEGLNISAHSHISTSTISINLVVENVCVVLHLQAYLKYASFIFPSCFWCEALELPLANLLELFRGPPEVPSPLLTSNFKVLISAPFKVQLPISPIDDPIEKSLLLNFFLKVNIKSGILSLEQQRAMDLYISLLSLCTSLTSMTDASLLQELPWINSCSSSDEIFSILAHSNSAFLLSIPASELHIRVPLRALEGITSGEVRGEPWTAAISPTDLRTNNKMEVKCSIKQNSIFLINPDMVASSIIAFKPMLLIAQSHSAFGAIASVHKLLSKVSAVQQQTSDDSSLVFHQSPFATLAEAEMCLLISHVSTVIQTSVHKSLLLRASGISVQASQEPRMEFIIKHIIASVSLHPSSESKKGFSNFVSSQILHNESEYGEPAVSLVFETKKASKKINKKHFTEQELAQMVKWHDEESKELFREDTTNFDKPHFSATLIGSINGLIISLNLDELFYVNYTSALLNDLLSAFKLAEKEGFFISELCSVRVSESSDFYQFANLLESHELMLQVHSVEEEDGLSRIFDAFKIKRNAKCFFGCSIGVMGASSHVQFKTSRGVEKIELSISSIIVQLISSFSLHEVTKSGSNVPLVINAMQEEQAIAALISAIYGRTPNLHLVVAAQLSSLIINAGPYGLVDPMPVICEMREVRSSWSTLLLSPTSWDSRSGIRTCIGEFKFCPIPEFAITVLSLQNLAQANTQLLMNRLQTMKRRLSLQPECPASAEFASTKCSDPHPAVTSDSSLAQTCKDFSTNALIPSERIFPPIQSTSDPHTLEEGSTPMKTSSLATFSSDTTLSVNNYDVFALQELFETCKRELSVATSNILLLKSSQQPLTLEQEQILRRFEESLPALQFAFNTCQSRVFDQLREIVAQKNVAVAEAVEHYRKELQSVQEARDAALRDLEAFRQLRISDGSHDTPSCTSSEHSQNAQKLWMADEDAPSCCICMKNFSLFVRRHHCRICLRIICSSCCKKALLPPEGVRKVLSCAECAR